jgi:hypothetical protein
MRLFHSISRLTSTLGQSTPSKTSAAKQPVQPQRRTGGRLDELQSAASQGHLRHPPPRTSSLPAHLLRPTQDSAAPTSSASGPWMPARAPLKQSGPSSRLTKGLKAAWHDAASPLKKWRTNREDKEYNDLLTKAANGTMDMKPSQRERLERLLDQRAPTLQQETKLPNRAASSSMPNNATTLNPKGASSSTPNNASTPNPKDIEELTMYTNGFDE